MSLNDCRGSAWLFRRWMLAVDQEIRDGRRRGVYIRWRRYEPNRLRRLLPERARIWLLRKVS